MYQVIPEEPSPAQFGEVAQQGWKKALEKVVPCCVVLKITQNRAFDTESASTSQATGFIVDKERGIILTNRHVVTPGPITAEAIFLNREEIPVYPVYYDPVHDFGFLRFDPSQLEFMRLNEIPLAPEAATVGLEVRVVGNDSGEKVSILPGVLARLDRDAPKYTSKGYNDFNTFYLQAASGTKGGSSGSPVIDCKGRAVGLNAGGKTKAASAYFLPLERVVRALKIIQNSLRKSNGSCAWSARVIPRGDLQTTFVFKGFDEVRRLGVTRETEGLVRAATSLSVEEDVLIGGSNSGMLVADSVVPGSSADGVLEPGDVLVRLGERVVTHFLDMEDILDKAVGTTISMEYERGGQLKTAHIKVTDLHDITPDSFLELAGGTLHGLSYQQARNNRLAVGQVYVAEAGYLLHRAGVPKHAVIASLAGHKIATLSDFRDVILQQPQGAKVPIEYYTFAERARRKQAIVYVDWKWYGPAKSWQRNDLTGLWNCRLEPLPEVVPGLAPPLAISVATVVSEETPMAVDDNAHGNGTDFSALEQRMRRSLVWFDVDIPVTALADGVHSRCFAGSGVIVYHGQHVGLVLVDRNTVAVGAGDIQITFGAYPCEIPGKLRFLHPLHNFAIVSYATADLPKEAAALVAAAELTPEPSLERGDKVQLLGLTRGLRVVRRESTVTSATSAVSITPAEVPRFRAVHEELVKLDHDFGVAVAGVLTNTSGGVRALWCSYSEQLERDDREWAAGMHAALFAPWVEKLKGLDSAPQLNMPPPPVVVLDAELEPLTLPKAAQYGLPSEWVARLVTYDPERRQVLRVRSRVAGSNATSQLKDGDIILSIGKDTVSSFRDVEKHLLQHTVDGRGTVVKDVVQGGGCGGGVGEVNGVCGSLIPLTIFRDGTTQEVCVMPGLEDGLGTNRLVHWCGAQLQATHRAVRELGFLPEGVSQGVYVSRWHHGSPAHRYGLYAMHWILEINGLPTPNLDALVEAVLQLKDGEFARVKVCHLESTKVKMLTIKPDHHYWPTWELERHPGSAEWTRKLL